MSWLPVVVTVEPEGEPITLGEAKAQCRVDGTDSDTELNIYIKAARIFAEEYTGTKIPTQTVLMRGRSFCDLGDLPAAPVISVTSITYLDTDGDEQTLSTDVYETVNTGLEPHIRLKLNQTFPAIRCASDAVRVTAGVGYTTVPEPIRAAVLLIVSSWFDNRSVGPVPDGAYSLRSKSRRF